MIYFIHLWYRLNFVKCYAANGCVHKPLLLQGLHSPSIELSIRRLRVRVPSTSKAINTSLSVKKPSDFLGLMAVPIEDKETWEAKFVIDT